MRVAWFSPQSSTALPRLDPSATVDHYDQHRAHDFVWTHFRHPYDVVVFDLADTADGAFVWPYVFHYPGVVILHATSFQHSRTQSLVRQHRHAHLQSERAFGGERLLRAPVLAARLVVVHDDAYAEELRGEFPAVPIRVIPLSAPASPLPPPAPHARFHVPTGSLDLARRAAARARDAGTEIDVVGRENLRQADVVVALEWPPTGAAPFGATRALAAGVATIVLETEAVAAWPTLDPQTWQPRHYGTHPAIAVSLDPRDQEHSLMLAMRRLAADDALRGDLGRAAAEWARRHADPARSTALWDEVLREAARLQPVTPRGHLPSHLLEDGTSRARAILNEFGERVDFLADADDADGMAAVEGTGSAGRG